MKAHPLVFYLGVYPHNSLITLAKIKIMRDGGLKKITGEKKIGDGQFWREAAFRISSHNVRKIPAGSGIEDLFSNPVLPPIYLRM